MAWNIRGKRILSDQEARVHDAAEAGANWLENFALTPALVAFALTFPTIWWLTGEREIAIIVSLPISIANMFFPILGVWCFSWGIGVVLWKILPPYWNWAALVAVLIWTRRVL